MSQMITLPADIAGNQEQFRRLFYNLRNSDWSNCQGFAYLHILVRDLDELTLNTPKMYSPDIQELKARITTLIRDVYECSVDRACAILNNTYIPTQEEYDYLCKKEFGDVENGSYEPGVYDSVPAEQSGWFNFCLHKWNMYHNEHDWIDESDRTHSGALKAYRKQIEQEWAAMPESEQLGWCRG